MESTQEKIIAPSILSADFARLGEEIEAVAKAEADWIHIDVMDGHFAPNITMGPMVTKVAKSVTTLPLDVHLMIENPDLYIEEFVEAGANLISVHVEATSHLNRTIQFIKDFGVKAGAVINPSTPVTAVEWVLEYIDYVLVMSVNPGFSGQSFIPNSLDKIKSLKEMINDKCLSTLIQVDGGVNKNTITKIAEAGADSFVAGSAIFGSKDYKKNINALKDGARQR
mmetsp:Transcript_5220/g.2978  ORF Transcript_5220/g.2978 Transcript_5220/m.2978 type:complete len:225 (+) Transcript_5220:443-1117(+)|eukprot:CAMPEP_0201285934 /NCGR_PEP_ID=MMETSP1317-20130820/114035_1 /ASSEMBLY_ACC=CAM_ASM_000770 /TAXON_ID=187299 /ORGANISM="Undescribed Undescribed, Strain Undescribed" /LENGTH=224 /DNA_ID=CAMNT_0047612165 /DNA_START=1190 /DNA_END=1864 /DNA_ORIENTATION=-